MNPADVWHPFIMEKIRPSLFGVLSLLLLAACQKDSPSEDLPPTQFPNTNLSPVPQISLENYPTDAVTAYEDSLSFSFLYYDGDGDSEAFVAGETLIRLIDKRDPERLVFDFFPAPTSVNALFGVHQAVLDHTILLDPDHESEQTSFTLQLRDRAGNWSNVIRTGTVRVQR